MNELIAARYISYWIDKILQLQPQTDIKDYITDCITEEIFREDVTRLNSSEYFKFFETEDMSQCSTLQDFGVFRGYTQNMKKNIT